MGCILVALMVAGGALAQQQYNAPKTVQQAAPGESCATKYKDCIDWCDRNRGANDVSANQRCRGQCVTYQETCEKTGTWRTPLGTTETRGLPPR